MADRSLPSDMYLYEQLVEDWPDAVLVFDSDNQRYIFANSAAERLVGYRREEILRLRPADLSHPDDAREIPAVAARAERDGVLRRRWRARRKDGSIVQTEMTLTRHRVAGRLLSHGQFRVIGDEASGRPDGETEHDVGSESESSSAPDGLRLLERTSLAVIALDRAGVICSWSSAAEDLYGWTAAEALGRRPDDLIAGDDPPFATVVQQVVSGHEWTGRLTAYGKLGEPLRLMVTGSPVRGEDGAQTGALLVSLPVGPASRSSTTRMRRTRVQCAACGREVAGTMRRKYCSEKCRQWAYYHRHRNARPGDA